MVGGEKKMKLFKQQPHKTKKLRNSLPYDSNKRNGKETWSGPSTSHSSLLDFFSYRFFSSVGKATPKLVTILLPQTPKSWDFKNEQPCLARWSFLNWLLYDFSLSFEFSHILTGCLDVLLFLFILVGYKISLESVALQFLYIQRKGKERERVLETLN